MKKVISWGLGILEALIIAYVIFLTGCLLFVNDFGHTQFGKYTLIEVDKGQASLLDGVEEGDLLVIKNGEDIVKGNIIGKGDPGCIFSEDFVIRDKTGIIFLDYNQPLFILNKIFALFKSGKMIDKEITVKGWYRRNPVPFVEIYEYTVDGKTKKVWTYTVTMVLYSIFAIAGIVLLFI